MSTPGDAAPRRAAKDSGRDPVAASRRVAVTATVAVLAGAAVAALAPWQAAVLAGWDAGGAVFLVWVWAGIWGLDPAGTQRLAEFEDSSRRASDLMLITASVACLVGVGLALIKGAHSKGTMEAVLVSVGVLSVVLSWAVVHTIFTLRYARLYYDGDDGGVDFNEDDPPQYRDFAYLAFTIGMTYQVSDTNLQTKQVRSTALRHAWLSYLFGTVIVAMTINVVAGLLK